MYKVAAQALNAKTWPFVTHSTCFPRVSHRQSSYPDAEFTEHNLGRVCRKGFRIVSVGLLIQILVLISVTSCFVVSLHYMRLNGYKSSASNEAAKIMMGFVDFLISGLAFDMILNLFYALFFAERLFRSKVEILEEEVTKTERCARACFSI